MKGSYYPNMPPLLDGEDNDHYSNRLIGVYGEDERPYDHRRNRQCALGWHNECSERTIIDADDRRCQCPCHSPDASLPPADVPRPVHPRLTEQEKAANRRRWWGLTDSANEPADVPRPPPLTDEELAAAQDVSDAAQGILSLLDVNPDAAVAQAALLVPRLIADLRASRAEKEARKAVLRAKSSLIAELQAEVERLRTEAQEEYARAEEAEQALQRLKATAHLP